MKDLLRQSFYRGPRRWFPGAVFLTGLALTLFATYYAARSLQVRELARFEEGVQHADATIRSRLDSHIALLRGAAGLMAAEPEVTRTKFRMYVDRLRLPSVYPGIRGLGFSMRIPESRKAQVIQFIRSQGETNFQIWPAGQREEYHAILYLEPLDWRNRAAIGYDMFTHPVRREAMVRAWETGNEAASGKVILVQEIDRDKQNGFLIYVPVYEGGDVPRTLAERRARLEGFVYSPFRTGELFGGRSLVGDIVPDLSIAIYDGEKTEPQNLLFQTTTESGRSRRISMSHTSTRMDVGGRTWTVIYSRPLAMGSNWWIVPLLLFGGTILSAILAYLTSSEARARRTAEESGLALRESEERLRLMLENARDFAILSTDPDGRIASWSAGAERMFGYRASEVLGRRVELIFIPEDRERGQPEKELQEALRTGRSQDDRWHLRKDGSKIFVSGVMRPMRDAGGNLIGFIKVARDETERLEIQERIQREKQFSDLIVNSLPGIFYVLDQRGNFLRWNEGLERATGFTSQEIGRMRPFEFFSKKDRPMIRDALREVLAKGLATREVDLLTKDGRRIPHFFSGRVITLGSVKWIAGMGIDISERKRAELELRHAEERLRSYASELEQRVADRTRHLQQSLESLEGVLYHVAHDLRAPLRAMASFTNIILEDQAQHFDQQGRDYAQRIFASARRMDELVQDLLAYGRLAHTAVPIGTVPLESEIDAVLNTFSEEIKTRHAEVGVHRPLPLVKANPTVLQEVLSQLVSNALKFVDPGTRPRIEIGADTDGMVRVWVQDNGIGIRPEYHERIFRVFERLHGMDDYSGTGIGLAIVRKGAERMGGRVGVESTPGEGAKFWVELPPATKGERPGKGQSGNS